MSMFRKDDILRHDHSGIIYYIRVTDSGDTTNNRFCGVMIQGYDTNWTPQEALKDPNKVLTFMGPENWFTVMKDIPQDPYILFQKALDNLELQYESI